MRRHIAKWKVGKKVNIKSMNSLWTAGNMQFIRLKTKSCSGSAMTESDIPSIDFIVTPHGPASCATALNWLTWLVHNMKLPWSGHSLHTHLCSHYNMPLQNTCSTCSSNSTWKHQSKGLRWCVVPVPRGRLVDHILPPMSYGKSSWRNALLLILLASKWCKIFSTYCHSTLGC